MEKLKNKIIDIVRSGPLYESEIYHVFSSEYYHDEISSAIDFAIKNCELMYESFKYLTIDPYNDNYVFPKFRINSDRIYVTLSKASADVSIFRDGSNVASTIIYFRTRAEGIAIAKTLGAFTNTKIKD